ncbi:MAG: hypothetical protein AABY15_03045 [Nanoarchaeota archaeon]
MVKIVSINKKLKSGGRGSKPIFKVPNVFITHKTKADDVYFGGSKPKIIEIESTISLFDDFDDTKRKEKAEVGYIAAYKVSDIKKFTHREIVKACDSKRQNLEDAFKAAFKSTSDGTRFKTHKGISTQVKSSILYIDTVLIFEQHRGLGVGNIAVKRFVEDLAGDCVVLVKPYAFEDSNSIQAHKKVKKFWESFGFKEMSYTGYYISNYHKIIKS